MPAKRIPHVNIRDHAGRKFYRLTFIEYSHSVDGNAHWWCECECGVRKTVAATAVMRTKNPVRSCGCLAEEVRTTHGQTYTKTYAAWKAMRQRCENPNRIGHKRYGGRGIKVCDRWLVFENFLADMKEKPRGTTLERLDNDRGYEPGNCEWKSYHAQSRNKSSNRFITYQNRTQCRADWAKEKGLNPSTLLQRLQRGWTIAEALETPPQAGHSRNG